MVTYALCVLSINGSRLHGLIVHLDVSSWAAERNYGEASSSGSSLLILSPQIRGAGVASFWDEI